MSRQIIRTIQVVNETVTKKGDDSAQGRLKAQGYTENEILAFNKALRSKKRDNALSGLPCKCTEQYKCEKCTLNELRQKFGHMK